MAKSFSTPFLCYAFDSELCIVHNMGSGPSGVDVPSTEVMIGVFALEGTSILRDTFVGENPTREVFRDETPYEPIVGSVELSQTIK